LALRRQLELELRLRLGGEPSRRRPRRAHLGDGLLDVLLRTRGAVGEHHESTLLSPIAAAVNAARTAAAMSAGGVEVGTPSPDAAEVSRYMARVDRLVAMDDSADTPD
jgi:hypothetical protein